MGACDATRDSLVAMMNTIPTDRACMPSDASPARVRAVVTPGTTFIRRYPD